MESKKCKSLLRLMWDVTRYIDSSDTWQVGRSVMLDPDPDQAACEYQPEESNTYHYLSQSPQTCSQLGPGRSEHQA